MNIFCGFCNYYTFFCEIARSKKILELIVEVRGQMGRDKCKEKPQIRETLCFFDEALMAKYGKVLAHKKIKT